MSSLIHQAMNEAESVLDLSGRALRDWKRRVLALPWAASLTFPKRWGVPLSALMHAASHERFLEMWTDATQNQRVLMVSDLFEHSIADGSLGRIGIHAKTNGNVRMGERKNPYADTPDLRLLVQQTLTAPQLIYPEPPPVRQSGQTEFARADIDEDMWRDARFPREMEGEIVRINSMANAEADRHRRGIMAFLSERGFNFQLTGNSYRHPIHWVREPENRRVAVWQARQTEAHFQSPPMGTPSADEMRATMDSVADNLRSFANMGVSVPFADVSNALGLSAPRLGGAP